MEKLSKGRNGDILVSVVVMTKNEEKNIVACLESLQNFMEIFVVDSNSTDKTVILAKERGAFIANFTWDGKYPKKKQWCLENLPFSYDWVLYVDADEIVTPQVAAEIKEIIDQGTTDDGYFVEYDYVFLGRVLKYGHKVNKLVLFKKNKGRFLDYDDLDVVNMWEVEGHYQPQITGSVGKLRSKMIHHDHEDLYSFYGKLNKYSDWEAFLRMKGALRTEKQATLRSRKIIQKIEKYIPFRWAGMFVYSYVLRLGLLDGAEGFYYALTLGIYHAMITMKIKETEIELSKGEQVGQQVR
jgi:glycosyltransferase involved in cell wall biosynthesis